MSARLKALWLDRTPRERWLLGLMLALVGFVLAWLLILRPLGDSLSAAKQRHGEAVANLGEARAQAAAIGGLERNRPAPLPGPLDVAITAAASEAGFQLSGLQPEGPGRVSIAIGAARPPALFGWIGRLEGQGFVVERLTASSNPDRTLSAQIVLRSRGG
ncbi:MAG TPA: type II secretion system protein GspM [Allosphingosinicella sp.]|jgi:general secretion pathway protein M